LPDRLPTFVKRGNAVVIEKLIRSRKGIDDLPAEG
jgi:hypothetical protein